MGQNHRLARHRAPGPEVQRSEACAGRSLFRPSPGRRAMAARDLDAGPWRRPQRGARRCGRTRAQRRCVAPRRSSGPRGRHLRRGEGSGDLHSLRRRTTARRRPRINPAQCGWQAHRRSRLQLWGFRDLGAGRRRAPDSRVALKSGRAHHTGFMRLACPQLGQKTLDAYVEKLSAIDPINWVPKATGPAFLIQDGTRDPFNPRADVLALYRAAHGSKELRFYSRPPPERGRDCIPRPVAATPT